MDFAQVEAKFKELKRKYDTDLITEEEFKAQLEELMIEDEEGQWWMIGYETGQWHYHDGEKWVQAELPKPTPPAPPHLAKLPSAPSLFQEESFLLHFLPTLVAAGIVELLGFLERGGDIFYWVAYELPFLLGAVVTFGLWVVIRQKVIRRWLMILTLAAGYVLAGLVYDSTIGGYVSLEGWLILFAIVSILGYGLSFIFAVLLRRRSASKQ